MATVDRYPNTPRYLGTRDVARELGVDGRTVSQWLARYTPDSATPAPAPDVAVGDVLGWAEERLGEWRTWQTKRPGRGAGGGRPRKVAEEFAERMLGEIARFEADRDAEEAAEEARRRQPE
ncbi:hypothetical protein [Nocardiopsis sp. HUAS JQ3]|uniref:hypothetical protein n=1 Tax=Nocardiopsis sp. HUAS JQ3 TaxID=3061629 RepID=UPI0023AA0F3F|nr:hypothetical protein [Nocardiopsis sp. HUAS JQ3]WDZ91152.1 hypothetical protein PV789_00820 [Nocardiopsis sp. HUAS JQ3]